MSDTLRMVFKNAEDRLSAISVPDPDPELTALEVEEVMDSILTTNIFNTTGGDLVSKVRAEVVSRTVDVLQDF
jgi:hypothetical protein